MKLMGSIIVFVTLTLTLLGATNTSGSYDHYLLSCGASSTTWTASGYDGRTWTPDENPTFSNTNFSSTVVASTTNRLMIDQTPFSTARIFTSDFTYNFPVSPGPKLIRLFFSPDTYSSRSLSVSSTEAYLTVLVDPGPHRLLRNFSAYLSLTSTSTSIVAREFYVRVAGPRLRLTFSPSVQGSYAFINGIEVVSAPESLYMGPTRAMPSYVLPSSVPGLTFDLAEPSTALETAYRLNVGGREESLLDDSGSMYRTWARDDPYLTGNFVGLTGYDHNSTSIEYTAATPSSSAPTGVYQSFRVMGRESYAYRKTVNLTWGFEVDLGFSYLVRLHWCEVVRDVNSSNSRRFDVYIGQLMAQEDLDIYERVGAHTPMFLDYVIRMVEDDPSAGSRGLLQIALHPNFGFHPRYYDVLLNGLEIFKINKSDGSLDGTNLSGPPSAGPITKTPSSRSNSTSHTILLIIGVVAGAILLAFLLFYLLIFRGGRRLRETSSKSKSRGRSASLPTHLCQRFTLEEIRLATSDFNDSLIVGRGGFGNVYKGTLMADGPTTAAIKRLNPLSSQGAEEFKMEIELLSKLRHVNLVSLIGYCDGAGEMILVYEYMSRGTLRDHLYPHSGFDDPDAAAHLSWRRRLEVCVGAARGLHYLHAGAHRMINHRDVKSTNILLDDRWDAKVSDFGLSKLGPVGGELSHVSTAVKGSFGYVDPEYYRRQQLTEKSDVYSFGVVLFEVLCGRAAVSLNLPKEQVSLRVWARRNQMSGTLDTIVDPTIKGEITPECLSKFGEVAESCVRDEGAHRPSMADVIGGLELALQLQLESVGITTTSSHHVTECDENIPDERFQAVKINSSTTDASVKLIESSGESAWTTSINDSTSRLFSTTTSKSNGESPSVFSQILMQEGR